jgi:dTDP-4-amino-4,6-dideoxygalactose transaminase
MDELRELAAEQELFVLEDACQSHGALYKNRKVGSLGLGAAFSFYPSKVMTVAGDGGMVTTNDEDFAELVAMLRDHGRTEKYLHQLVGFNFRLSEAHAAIGRVQLKRLPEWIEQRRENAKKYNERLENIAGIISIPVERPWARHVYYVYTIMCMKRDQLAEHLKKNGIAAGIYYPVPSHQQPCIAKLIKPKKLHYTAPGASAPCVPKTRSVEVFGAELPKTIRALHFTEECAKDILSLPMHPYLSDGDINYVCDTIKSFY